MQNLVIQEQSQLEQDLIALYTGTSDSKQFFKQSVMNILKSQTVSSFAKADQILEVFTSIDAKIEYVKVQQRLLASLKKQLDQSKAYAKVGKSHEI